VITTTEPEDYPDVDLQEVATQHQHAESMLRTHPFLSTIAARHALTRALYLIPPLSAEITRLRTRLIATLADLRNLVAAARATLGADADGEADPLYYLRDELQAQDRLPRDDQGRP
jgi:hypothetical protein